MATWVSTTFHIQAPNEVLHATRDGRERQLEGLKETGCG